MTSTVIAFDDLTSEMRRYLRERAGNYDSYNAFDLWDDVPSKLKHSEDAVMSFLRGNDALGVEAREVMHVQSRFNGGADTPDNLMLGPESLNGEISSADMTTWEINEVLDLNAEDVEVILDADPDILVEAWEGLSYVASAAASASEVFADAEVVGEIPFDVPFEVPVDLPEAGGEFLGELGGALMEGLVPAMAAYKVGSYVHDNCDAPDVDPTAAALAASGGTVLLYCNPLTGPLCWGLSGLYATYKLAGVGYKLYRKYA